MGSTVHIVVTGNPAVLDGAIERAIDLIEHLESRWSRFRPDSDVSRLNATTDGRPVTVAPETLLLVERAVEAWRQTNGRFDPTVLRAIVTAGYDRDFDAITSGHPAPTAPGVPTAPTATVDLPPDLDAGCVGIVFDLDRRTIALPRGIGFDPGGLGKGLAADLVVSALRDEQGIDGALVNLGGDLRCSGQPPASGQGAWVVAAPGDVDHRGRTRPDRVLRLADGGVATSTCLRRRWQTTSGSAHHLIDPTTGRPAAKAASFVTVLAGTGCDAEILATAIAVDGGLEHSRHDIGGAAAIVTTADGAVQVAGPLDHYTVGSVGSVGEVEQ
jgi:thiamine biosynthesis lipoprotein